MLLKSIVIASAAASLAPILGASLFFGLNAFQSVSPTVTGKLAPYQDWGKLPIDEADSARTFEVPELRSTAVEASTLLRETKQKAVGFGSWRTTICCADGQPILKHGDCDRLKSIDVAKNSELAAVDSCSQLNCRPQDQQDRRVASLATCSAKPS
jgi:hypothetical protein